MSQGDTVWLDLRSRLRDVYLRENQRAYSALQLLPNPDSQQPQLITMIGGITKSSFIEKCFDLKRSENHEKILMRTVPEHFGSESPLLIADCELHNSRTPPTLLDNEKNLGAQLHALKWLRNIPRTMGRDALAHIVYAQLLFPFSTIVCIFASDFDGIEKVAKFLASWIMLRNRKSVFPSFTLARVLIFVPWEKYFDEKLATTNFLKQVRTVSREDKGPLGDESLTNVEFERSLKDSAFEVRLLALSAVEDEIHLKTFRTRLLCESEEVYNLRKVAKIAFSARHFQAFFKLACRHFADSIVLPFDIVHASRVPNPVPTEFSSHLANFVKCVEGETSYMIYMTIASALYLDSFPPGAHIFHPRTVFDTLYSKMLENALEFLPNCEQVIEDVKITFCEVKDYSNTAWIHQQLLRCFSDVWKTTFSSSTCLSCLARKPNSVLPCKHSLCDTCVIIHGKSDLEEPWKFQFDDCPLCEDRIQTSILLKPPTAGVRCLVLDGGVYTDFEILDKIEEKLHLPMNLQAHFDMVNGNSLGAWVILTKFYKDGKCVEDNVNYQKIGYNIQGPIEDSKLGSRFSDASMLNGHEVALKRLESVFKAVPLWSGSLQSSMKLASSLSGTFGETTLFEYHPGSTRLCMTVSRPKDRATCVLSNYNGDGKRPSTYEHVREQKIKNETKLSQCARMALSLKSVHGYQMKERNASNKIIEITLTEQGIAWGREGRTPDILLALGACVPPYNQSPKPEMSPEWLVDFRRYNDAIKLDSSVDILLASLFYVELLGVPQIDELGLLLCRTQIQCRIAPSSSAYRSLVEKLRRNRARFYYDYQSIPCVNRQLYEEAGRGIAFSRCIEMSLPTIQHSIDVKIDGIVETSPSISNCPYRIQYLIEDQGLDCVFGNKDHRRRYFGSICDSKPRFI